MLAYKEYKKSHRPEEYEIRGKVISIDASAYTNQKEADEKEDACYNDVSKKQMTDWLNLLKLAESVKRKRQLVLEKKFQFLANKWREETVGQSLSHRVTRNRYYVDIIGLGPDALPLIFRELEKEPEYWFVALMHIAQPEQDPISDSHYGDIEKMRQDWLKWGKDHKKF